MTDQGDTRGPSTWRGTRVELRAIEPEDWTVYDEWNADDEQNRNLDRVPFPQSKERVRRFAQEASAGEPDGDNVRLVITDLDGNVVGDLTTHGCDARVGCLSYGVNVRAAFRHRGYATEAIRLVLRYDFRELRYQKAAVHVFDYNGSSVHLHERLGFTREGRIRRVAFTGGRHHDVLVLGITADEFTAADVDGA